MAEIVAYVARITPYESQVQTAKKGGEIVECLPSLTTTNRNALEVFLQKIKAGVDVSTVVTAINAL